MTGRAHAPSSLPLTRSSGVLLHVSSLPGRHGIGNLGPAAHKWIDDLSRSRQTWWQLLPLGPPDLGDSPYQAFSAFAGNPDFISPERLAQHGLIHKSDLAPPPTTSPDRIDYPRVRASTQKLLAIAFDRFRAGAARAFSQSFAHFCQAEATWLDDYALFMALREAHAGKPWYDWPKAIAFRRPDALRQARRELADAIQRHQFAQFLFFRQLGELRSYAAQKSIRLIGDLPIFVSGNSSDVWANPHLFQLDRQRRPQAVSGVPPDYFSKTGQRWGNPLYDWRAMEQDGFAWWIARVRAALRQADLVRIDHFRGLEAYWRIPAHLPTAVGGRWVKAPGQKLLATLRRKLDSLPFIAEDLGLITPEVEALRDQFDLPGMRVLHFAFDGTDSPHLPHNYIPHAIAYTGTHDNDTTAGWYASLTTRQKTIVQRYLPAIDVEGPWAMIRLAWSSVASLAIVPAQDLLGLDTRARMNHPARGRGNWRWRLRSGQLTRDHLSRLATLTHTYARDYRLWQTRNHIP